MAEPAEEPDAEIIQLGARGVAGRGSRTRPSAAARGLADSGRRPPPRTRRPRPGVAPEEPSLDEEPAVEELADEELADEELRTDEDRSASHEVPPDRSSERIPPTVDLGALVAEMVDVANRIVERFRTLPVDQVKGVAGDPLRAALDLARRLGVDWYTSVDQLADFIRSRMSGSYPVDEFGFDPDFTEQVYLPVLRWLSQYWFRVEVRGAENLPTKDAALLVSNHAGTLPLDGMILHCTVFDEIGRHVRMLGADLIFATPYSGDLARKTGTTLACQEDAERLLAGGQLVSVYPEGFKGLGKPYADRYKLQRFGRGGFVSAAVRAQVPIVPVSVVGSEEIYPLLGTAPVLSRALGLPYFPITPTFPWFGLLGAIPLPSKWIIQFGEAITTDQLPPGAAEDPMVVFNVTDQVRETIQQTLYTLLMQRRSAFF